VDHVALNELLIQHPFDRFLGSAGSLFWRPLGFLLVRLGNPRANAAIQSIGSSFARTVPTAAAEIRKQNNRAVLPKYMM